MKDRGRKSRGVFAKESACVDVPAGGTFQLGRILLKCHEFFCSSAEFDQYVTDMELDAASVIKADMDRAVEEAKATFEV